MADAGKEHVRRVSRERRLQRELWQGREVGETFSYCAHAWDKAG
jgi:hypothetical protein